MSATAISSATQSPFASQTLNQADFLKLLVTQMSSQDPLNPQSDTEFASQLAQFSSLQANQTMATDLQSIQADSLIGQTVTVTPSSGSGQITGVVSGVQISSGTPQILINGQAYQMNQVSSVTPTTTNNSN